MKPARTKPHHHIYAWTGGYDEPEVARCKCGDELSKDEVLARLNRVKKRA